MKIRNYVALWAIAILGSITFLFLMVSFNSIKNEYRYLLLSKSEAASGDMKSAVSELMRSFSGGVSDHILSIAYGESLNKTLIDMKDQFGADWSFVTINNDNYIYPYNVRASTLVADSRPWYISSLSAPEQFVGNEFHSTALNASVVTFSVAFKRGNTLFVGGLIFREKRFFDMLSSKLINIPFLILNGNEIIYPSKIAGKINKVNFQKNVVKFDDELYRTYRENYDHVMSLAGVQSNTNYDLVLLIPNASLTRKTNLSLWIFLSLLLIADGGAFIIMFLIVGHLVKSVESLPELLLGFDIASTTFEPEPALEKHAKKFKETRMVYEKFVDLFQDLNAHVEELKATNEELEASYEDIENLSNTLARESNELKELSEASKLIALSTDVTEASEILLERISNIYDCDGVKLIEISDNGLKTMSERGLEFETPNLLPLNERVLLGKISLTSWNGKNYAIVPILFESKPIAIVIMMFKHGTPSERELESISNFSVHFAALLNSHEMLAKLKSSYIYLAGRLAELSEFYDYETGSHVQRVGKYSEFVAKELGMSQNFVKDIEIYAMIHDIGKFKVPRDILTKKGTLTREEFEEIKKHTIYGEQILGDAPFLEMARHIARSHHEKFDGSGYPDGLRGNDIPLEARITAIADVYDALRSPRRYKKGFSHEKAVRIITIGDGRVEPSHFEPDILDIFKKYHLEFARIYEKLSEEEER